MRKHFKTISYFTFLALGLVLLYITFRNQDLTEIWQTLTTANWMWAIVVLGISVLNHISRVLRWRLLMEPLGRLPSVWNAFVALMSGYFVSLAIPRLGEVTRSMALVKTNKMGVQPVFGTIITERIIDIACLGLVAISALIIEFDTLKELYYEKVHEEFSVSLSEKVAQFRWLALTLILIGTLSLAILLANWRKLRRIPWVRKIIVQFLQVWRGMISITRMPHKWQFLAHTLFIWVTYFLMTYLWFFSFPESSGLSWQAGLALMVVGSVGRSLPIQGGGMGAYHFLFKHAIYAYGVSMTIGASLAVMIHGLQLVYYLVLGGLCLLWLMLYRK